MFNCKHLIAAAEKLRDSVNSLTFSPPVTHVYNPLDYAWKAHKLYLTKYANSTKKVVMLGMNPGGYVTFLQVAHKALKTNVLPSSQFHGKYR